MQEWALWALFSAVFAALTAILAKVGLKGIDSDLATFIRTLVIAAALIALLSYTNKWRLTSELNARNWLFLTLSGLATGASWLAYFKALSLGKASQVAPIDKFSLVLVVVFAVFFLGERPSVKEWIGIALIASGVFTLVFASK
nr:EamA family transporter [uncultured Campylobacter sp.]